MRIQILILGFKGLKLKFELRMYRLYGFLDTASQNLVSCLMASRYGKTGSRKRETS